MKKFVLLFVLFAFLPLLNSCSMNDAGIIKWTYKDELLDWKDIKSATYYELVFYQTDPDTGEVVTPLTPAFMGEFIAYAYDSQYSFYGLANHYSYNLKIKVYYEDGSTEDSDLIHITHDLDFPYPIQFGFGEYVGYGLSWHMYSEGVSDLVNYTLRINGEEFDIDTNQYDMDDYDSGIYKIQIRVNYETGSSKLLPFP